TCILGDIGVWGQDRHIYALLEAYPQVFVETSQLSLAAGGLVKAVRNFGAERFVFGSGFPERYFEAAMLDLQYADLSSADKDLISHGNLERILSGAEL
ncbi:MAG: hypothetical protein HQL31_13525, partial [Planctomycetes bacterium]|nr:hypothetical protein [Planctomycetota bacterium]